MRATLESVLLASILDLEPSANPSDDRKPPRQGLPATDADYNATGVNVIVLLATRPRLSAVVPLNVAVRRALAVLNSAQVCADDEGTRFEFYCDTL